MISAHIVLEQREERALIPTREWCRCRTPFGPPFSSGVLASLYFLLCLVHRSLLISSSSFLPRPSSSVRDRLFRLPPSFVYLPFNVPPPRFYSVSLSLSYSCSPIKPYDDCHVFVIPNLNYRIQDQVLVRELELEFESLLDLQYIATTSWSEMGPKLKN